MKILYLERALTPFSLVYDQIKRISRNGVDYSIINVKIGKGTAYKFNDDRLITAKCPFFPKLERVKGALFVYNSMKAYNDFFKKYKFDLVHAHFAYPEGLAACEFKKKYNIPYVITVRGDDVLLYPHRNKYLYKNICSVISNADGIIGVSKNILGKVESLSDKNIPVFYRPDGIPECFCRELQTERFKEKTILFAGSFLPVKNIIRMLDAFKLISEYDNEVKFIIAGEGPLLNKMKFKLRELNIDNKVIFLGQVEHKELAEEMRKTHVFCLPSVSEGWGNVITEAMACGTPVVGANVGGIPEQIISKDYGYLCDPYSPEDIADKIIKALNRKDWNYKKISERGKLYTREDTAKKIVDIYKSILSKRKYSPRVVTDNHCFSK